MLAEVLDEASLTSVIRMALPVDMIVADGVLLDFKSKGIWRVNKIMLHFADCENLSGPRSCTLYATRVSAVEATGKASGLPKKKKEN